MVAVQDIEWNEHDDHRFFANETYRYLEATPVIGSDHCVWKNGELREGEAAAWARKRPVEDRTGDSPTPRLRILLLEGKTLGGSNREQLQCSRNVYYSIQRAWKLPDGVLRVLLKQGLHASFDNDIRFGLAFRTCCSVFGGCVLVYDRKTLTTDVLFEVYHWGFGRRLLEDAQAAGQAAFAPTTFLYLVLQHSFFAFEKGSKTILQSLTEIESRVESADAFGDDVPYQADDTIDLARTMIELTKGANDIALLQYYFKVHEVQVAAVRLLHDKLRVAAKQQSVHDFEWPVGVEVANSLDLLSTDIQEQRRRFEYRSAGVQAQRQTVYSLVAARDNRLSYEAAEVSRSDSSDMRVIAWVTLGFLPATFAATFFSTTFFDWKATSWSDRVSSWVWIYILVSVGLTTCVILTWRTTSKAVEKKRAKMLNNKRKVKQPNPVYDEEGHRVNFRYTCSCHRSASAVEFENKENEPWCDVRPLPDAVGGAEVV